MRCIRVVLLALLSTVTVLTAASSTTLKAVAPRGFRIGVAVSGPMSEGRDPASVAIVAEQFNSVSPENVLKWERVHPIRGKYTFEPADRYVELGRSHGMFVVGHVLLWHQQTPRWVFEGEAGTKLDRATLLARLKDHIDTVAGRYRGKVHGWDVVNEALDEDGTLRRTPWLQIIGDDFIEKAFEFARAADPDAELYYNDYNLWKPAKRDAAIALVKKLRAKGLRVDAIGEQAHWGVEDPPLQAIEDMLAAFKAAGIRTDITELDMDVLPRDPEQWGADLAKQQTIRAKSNIYPDGLPAARQQALARRYADVFTLFLKYDVGRATFWGLNDGVSWLNNFPIPGRVNYPLLWGRDGKPKPAYDAVVEVMKKASAAR